jgi:hypothetical protein
MIAVAALFSAAVKNSSFSANVRSPGLAAVGIGEARERGVGGAQNFAGEQLGNFRSGKCH